MTSTDTHDIDEGYARMASYALGYRCSTCRAKPGDPCDNKRSQADDPVNPGQALLWSMHVPRQDKGARDSNAIDSLTHDIWWDANDSGRDGIYGSESRVKRGRRNLVYFDRALERLVAAGRAKVLDVEYLGHADQWIKATPYWYIDTQTCTSG